MKSLQRLCVWVFMFSVLGQILQSIGNEDILVHIRTELLYLELWFAIAFQEWLGREK